jgi:hypothetical protein
MADTRSRIPWLNVVGVVRLPTPNSLEPMTDVQRPRTWSTDVLRAWGPWLALAAGVVIIALGGVLLSAGVSP